jgi:heme exporter protein A
MNSMLSATDVSCSRGGRRLFSGVNLRVERGQWLHVRGANGAGKTSLLRILAGLSRPDDGDVCWQGEPISVDSARWHADLLFIGHAQALKDELTPVENLRAASELEGYALSEAQACQALIRFGLRGREHVPVRMRSAGQRRRALLARTLTRNAPAWILDEPLTALDAGAVADFGALLGEHLASGGLAIVTSHQPLPLAAGVEVML